MCLWTLYQALSVYSRDIRAVPFCCQATEPVVPKIGELPRNLM